MTSWIVGGQNYAAKSTKFHKIFVVCNAQRWHKLRSKESERGCQDRKRAGKLNAATEFYGARPGFRQLDVEEGGLALALSAETERTASVLSIVVMGRKKQDGLGSFDPDTATISSSSHDPLLTLTWRPDREIIFGKTFGAISQIILIIQSTAASVSLTYSLPPTSTTCESPASARLLFPLVSTRAPRCARQVRERNAGMPAAPVHPAHYLLARLLYSVQIPLREAVRTDFLPLSIRNYFPIWTPRCGGKYESPTTSLQATDSQNYRLGGLDLVKICPRATFCTGRQLSFDVDQHCSEPLAAAPPLALSHLLRLPQCTPLFDLGTECFAASLARYRSLLCAVWDNLYLSPSSWYGFVFFNSSIFPTPLPTSDVCLRISVACSGKVPSKQERRTRPARATASSTWMCTTRWIWRTRRCGLPWAAVERATCACGDKNERVRAWLNSKLIWSPSLGEYLAGNKTLWPMTLSHPPSVNDILLGLRRKTQFEPGRGLQPARLTPSPWAEGHSRVHMGRLVTPCEDLGAGAPDLHEANGPNFGAFSQRHRAQDLVRGGSQLQPMSWYSNVTFDSGWVQY
ncbi:hypothetical protein C8F04DRAFT_1179662 [Mycena alexandri]|uniref:Uncharacterized protein n=1 Tax=Mycena alexandri TaxID=1745969 RepID=A0AAD6X6Q0_9AGAR|nr:hypothetical protein C8F04DRAFT_1179662 [Mycena alexandri]